MVNVLFNHSFRFIWGGGKEKWFSYLDNFQGTLLLYFDSWKIYYQTIDKKSILNILAALRIISQGCFPTPPHPQTFKWTTAGKSKTVQELPFLLGILAPHLLLLHAACSRQLMQNCNHSESTQATVRTLLMETACPTSLLAKRQGDGP